jgi:hypothetical protein
VIARLGKLAGALSVIVLLTVAGTTTPALAQDTTGTTLSTPRSADIGLETGEFDERLGDWPITAVTVRGEMDEGTNFTVLLLGKVGQVVWTGTATYKDPVTTIEVKGVSVRQVEAAKFESSAVLGNLVAPDLDKPTASGGGSSGQVATSMTLVIIIAVILFRTPLPAAATQRWTK